MNTHYNPRSVYHRAIAVATLVLVLLYIIRAVAGAPLELPDVSSEYANSEQQNAQFDEQYYIDILDDLSSVPRCAMYGTYFTPDEIEFYALCDTQDTNLLESEVCEPITEDEEQVKDEVPMYVELEDWEMNLFATLVYYEGGNESLECQKAIASVVVNRMKANEQSLTEVIYARNQFSTVSQLSSGKFTDSTMEAVQHVCTFGPTIPEYVTFFRANHYFDWGPRYQNYRNIDHTYFTYDTVLKERLESDAV